MKREYIFLVLILIIIYLIYLIISYKYKEYRVNTHIDYIAYMNEITNKEIEKNKEILDYLNTNAYKNKILKQEQWFRNRDEKVIIITTQKEYNKYTTKEPTFSVSQKISVDESIINNMNIKQRWFYFLFDIDTR